MDDPEKTIEQETIKKDESFSNLQAPHNQLPFLLNSKINMKFHNIKIFLFLMCILAVCQGISASGLVSSTLTTIEKRFGFSSTRSSLIAIGYDVSNIIFLLPVSFYGGSGNKARWIGCGAFILGIGTFLYSVPHFIVGPYIMPHQNNTDLCSSNIKKLTYEEKTFFYSPIFYLTIFILAGFINGIGSSPIYSLIATYFDDNLPSNRSPMYFGLYYTSVLMGPALGYMIGSFILRFHIDIDKFGYSKLSMDSNNPRRLGAWWIGFLANGIVLFLISIPIASFPKKITPNLKKSKIKIDKLKTKDFPKTLKNLIFNPVFTFINFSGSCEGALVSGFILFSPKFVETNYNLTASHSSLLIGAATIPSGGFGMIIGSYFVKRFRMGAYSSLKFSLLLQIVTIIFCFFLTFRCSDLKIAGVNAPYLKNSDNLYVSSKKHNHNSNSSSLITNCNSNCSCDENKFNFVCGENHIIYMSPCLAGCKDFLKNQTYGNCSCVEEDTFHKKSKVKTGICSTDCNLIYLFFIFYCGIIFVTFMIWTPVLTATLRCVSHNQKAFALGVQWLFARTLGMTPAPIVFGFLIDKACLLWGHEGMKEKGSCFVYTGEMVSVYFMIILISLKSISFISLYIAFFFLKKSNRILNDSRY